jgi:ribosomal protein S18 acetylase RimI-like enzyme
MTGVSENRSGDFVALTPKQIRAHLDAFLAVAADVPGEYWAEQHFLEERPDKWRLSVSAWKDGHLIGYAIASGREPGRAHLHHFMVHATHRGRGTGAAMLDALERRVRAAGYSCLSLKVEAGNDRAAHFYTRLGFAEYGMDGDYHLFRKAAGDAG